MQLTIVVADPSFQIWGFVGIGGTLVRSRMSFANPFSLHFLGHSCADQLLQRVPFPDQLCKPASAHLTPSLAWHVTTLVPKPPLLQDAEHWVDILLTQRKGLKFSHTRSYAIIFQDTLPAYCISKRVMMKFEEIMHQIINGYVIWIFISLKAIMRPN